MTQPSRKPRILPSALLAALIALYVAWFLGDRHFVAAMLVFVLPQALLLAGTALGSAKAVFWAGVMALFLFSHAVMTAWAEPDERPFGIAVVVLSVLLVFASSWPGLRARFGGKR